jgi:23S rRNA pseudouridine2605 synthase
MEPEMLAEMTYGLRHDGEVLKATAATLAQKRRPELMDRGRTRRGPQPADPPHAGGARDECLRLVRVAIGGVQLGDLPKGTVRTLTEMELKTCAGAPAWKTDDPDLTGYAMKRRI